MATLIASDDTTRVARCDWPAGLTSDSFDTTIVPFMQGMLLPKVWPHKTWLYDTLSFGRGLYQPWWGHQQGEDAMLVILESPDDAGCHFVPLWLAIIPSVHYILGFIRVFLKSAGPCNAG